jgi:hypothetical protein
MDPYLPYSLWSAGSGSDLGIRIQEGKNDQHATIIEKVMKFHVLSAGCSLLKAKGFSYSLSVLYGGLGITVVSFLQLYFINFRSVADPDPGSGAFLTPGSNIRNNFFSGSRISDPGSQTHIFESLVTIFWVKSSIIL